MKQWQSFFTCHTRSARKTTGECAQASYDHNVWNRGKNADPELFETNRILIDQLEGRTVKEYIFDRYEEFYRYGAFSNPDMRRDGAGTADIIMEAVNVHLEDGKPPEGFDLDGWIEKSMEWVDKTFNPPNHEIHFKNEYGENVTIKDVQNIYSAAVHLDEACPHIHVLAMPIDEKGKLRYHSYIDGPKDLSDKQASYYEAVKEFGLERGKKGAVTDHNNRKQYYANINTPMAQKAPEPVPGETIEAYKERVDKEIEICHCHMADQDRDHEKDLRDKKAEHNTYVKDTYWLHGEINSALGNGHGKDIDMDFIRDVGRVYMDQKKLDKALEAYPDRELAETVENGLRDILFWQNERELVAARGEDKTR